MTSAPETPPLRFRPTSRQKYGPWAVGWVVCVVVSLLLAVTDVADARVEAIGAVVFAIGVTAVLVIASGVRQVGRWERQHGIPEKRAAERREIAAEMKRLGFERRPDESLTEAVRRWKALSGRLD